MQIQFYDLGFPLRVTLLDSQMQLLQVKGKRMGNIDVLQFIFMSGHFYGIFLQ